MIRKYSILYEVIFNEVFVLCSRSIFPLQFISLYVSCFIFKVIEQLNGIYFYTYVRKSRCILYGFLKCYVMLCFVFVLAACLSVVRMPVYIYTWISFFLYNLIIKRL